MLYVSLGLNAAVQVPVLAWIAQDSAFGDQALTNRIRRRVGGSRQFTGTILLTSVALIALLATVFEDAAALDDHAADCAAALDDVATVPLVGLGNPVVSVKCRDRRSTCRYDRKPACLAVVAPRHRPRPRQIDTGRADGRLDLAHQPVRPGQKRAQEAVVIHARLQLLELHDILDPAIEKIPARRLPLGMIPQPVK